MPLAPVREQVDRGELRLLACDVPLPPQRVVVS